MVGGVVTQRKELSCSSENNSSSAGQAEHRTPTRPLSPAAAHPDARWVCSGGSARCLKRSGCRGLRRHARNGEGVWEAFGLKNLGDADAHLTINKNDIFKCNPADNHVLKGGPSELH
ncbi:hypothetical protein E2C01_042879 [Portunus trituberculatus]|uniref:Uncharacterized protein n=1 Tax=Portunus trituberculatus TaxID=210409 RepID=A0A5B7FUS2_PORTR|nr:hypothetical protein [Portunus trituberculatus]